MLSQGAIRAAHVGQCEPGVMMDSPLGNRYITTLQKLPSIRPNTPTLRESTIARPHLYPVKDVRNAPLSTCPHLCLPVTWPGHLTLQLKTNQSSVGMPKSAKCFLIFSRISTSWGGTFRYANRNKTGVSAIFPASKAVNASL